MRDVAYGQVPKGRRVELHVRFSDWVSSLPSTADEFVEIVAWHLEQACLLSREVARSPIEPPIREAAAALADAARRAERRESLREAHRYYTRALEVLHDNYEKLRVELRLRRADMAMMLGLVSEATDELLEVADDASSWVVSTSSARRRSCSATSTSGREGRPRHTIASPRRSDSRLSPTTRTFGSGWPSC